MIFKSQHQPSSLLLQVRTNAALALGSPSSYPTDDVLESVWSTILKAIDNSEYQQSFTDHQQASSLRMQVTEASSTAAFCHYVHVEVEFRVFVLHFSTLCSCVKLSVVL